MSAFIQSIATSVPEHAYSQEFIREQMKELISKTETDRRVIHQIYSRSGIKKRHSVLNDFNLDGHQRLFFNGHGPVPGTETRNDHYIREGRKLFVKTAESLLNQTPDLSAGDITHLITISCTGFYAPGPDFDIIRNLGLNPNIERYHLGFMGCYAAVPGLKMAAQICDSSPDANVMVISTELCTLHFQANNRMDDMISTSVFADGSGGAVMSAKKPAQSPHLEVKGFASAITDKGSEDMAWTIGDSGFNMVLSSYIPDLLAEGIEPFLNPVLKKFNLQFQNIDFWAVHPGGRAILDKLQSQLSLNPELLQYSRKVLSEYGNMSSATILFVLKEILESTGSANTGKLIALAFGPGLTIESGYFELSR